MKRVHERALDDVSGCEHADMPRLTERFYGVERSRSRANRGTGPGLERVTHILEAHRQHPAVESIPGKGSRFGFVLESVHMSRNASSMIATV